MKSISNLNERNNEQVFPFSYTGWDDACGEYGDIQFLNVIFNEPFGKIKQGEKFVAVVIEYSKGVLKAYRPPTPEAGSNGVGETITVNWKVVPTE